MAVSIMATAIAAIKGTLSEPDVMRPQTSYSQRMKPGTFSVSPLTPKSMMYARKRGISTSPSTSTIIRTGPAMK